MPDCRRERGREYAGLDDQVCVAQSACRDFDEDLCRGQIRGIGSAFFRSPAATVVTRLLTVWLRVLELDIAELERSAEFLEHERLSLEHVVLRERRESESEDARSS